MDAHAFRCLCHSLQYILLGARVEKIQRPTPDLHVFTVYIPAHNAASGTGQKRFLMLRSGRHAPLLFFASHKLPAPQEPGAVVMRLRRYCAGRRVKEVRYDWLNRKIGLLMSHEPETWLILDLRNGPSLASDFTSSSMDAQSCVDIQELRKDFNALHTYTLENEQTQQHKTIDEPTTWRDYPFMTPALRKTLVHLAMEDPAEAAALVVDILADMEKGLEQSTRPTSEAIEQGAPKSENNSKSENNFKPEPLDLSCNLFVYCENDKPTQLSAWPLPKLLQSKKKSEENAEVPKITEHYFSDALEATSFFGQGVAFAGITEDAQRIASKPFMSEATRLQRLLTKLDGEEKRLQKMLALRDEAVVLQGILYQLSPDAKMSGVDAKMSSVDAKMSGIDAKMSGVDAKMSGVDAKMSSVTVPLSDSDYTQANETGRDIFIKLNPLRTVRENMADMFHQSRRGARGLEILAKRRADIRAQYAIAMNEARALTEEKTAREKSPTENMYGSQHAHVRTVQENAALKIGQKGGQKVGQKNGEKSRQKNVSVNGQKNTLKSGQKGALTAKEAPLATKYAKLVQAFKSCDGLRLLRGRNSEGNAAVLKLAQPYDIWMHAADGPSAHLIIKRDHAQHEVPQETLEEAAKLVAEKSWQRDDAQAEIMCAYAKDVRAVKGAAAGKVRVERIFTSLSVRLA